MVLFILSEIINLKNQKKPKKQKISVLNEFHASLIKKPKAAHVCYLLSLYPYQCSLKILSKICDALDHFKESAIKKKTKTFRKPKKFESLRIFTLY